MGKLTAKEFVKIAKDLPDEEKYKLSETLDPHEQFLLRTLYTAPIPIPVGTNTVKRIKTEEEKEKAHQDLVNILKEFGVIKDESEIEYYEY